MSFVKNLAAWTDQNKFDLSYMGVMSGRFLDFVTVNEGIKSSATINLISSTLTAQAQGCDLTPAGTTNLSQVSLSVCPLQVEEYTCMSAINNTYLEKTLPAGSTVTSLPFEQAFSEERAIAMSVLVENIAFNGDTDAGSGSLALCDGYLKVLDDDDFDNAVNGNPTGITVATGITSANIKGIIEGMILLRHIDIMDRDDVYIYGGYDTYAKLVSANLAANYFHYPAGESPEAQKFVMNLWGYNVNFVAIKALQGKNAMFLTSKENIRFATDLKNEEEDFLLEYVLHKDSILFRSKWKQGSAFVDLDKVVYFKLVP